MVTHQCKVRWLIYMFLILTGLLTVLLYLYCIWWTKGEISHANFFLERNRIPNFILGISPLRKEEGDGTPLQYSRLKNPMDGGAWWAAVHGVAKSRTRLSDFTFTFMHWRRQCNPLQCSCLENPRDGGAWWAAVYGGAQSRTRLKRLSSSSSL